MKRILIMCLAGLALTVALSACGSSDSSSAAVDAAVQKDAELFAIDQIEKTWHQASSTKNVDLMMTIWAPDATFNVGTQTLNGQAADPELLRDEGSVRSSPATTGCPTRRPTRSGPRSNGDKGTLYFECHYVDIDDRQGDVGRRRRPERAEDQRQVGDRELRGGDARSRA